MRKIETNSDFQCSKCGEICHIYSQYNLVMCPACKKINDISIDCDENDEI